MNIGSRLLVSGYAYIINYYVSTMSLTINKTKHSKILSPRPNRNNLGR